MVPNSLHLYFSKKLTPAETHYKMFDYELMANYLAIKHFHHFVEGRKFQLLTDHKPLTTQYVVKPPQEQDMAGPTS